jgi:hypothetical protein
MVVLCVVLVERLSRPKVTRAPQGSATVGRAWIICLSRVWGSLTRFPILSVKLRDASSISVLLLDLNPAFLHPDMEHIRS